MNLLRLAALLVLVALGSAAWPAEPLKLVIPAPPKNSSEHTEYFVALLKLALTKEAGEAAPVQIERYAESLSSRRQIKELKAGGLIDVMWDGSDEAREKELLPVRISLLRHLNDFRVFLIRREDQDKFSAIHELEALKAMSAGSGVNWPSTRVLRANGLPGETAVHYQSLFPMLLRKRFDYFPRGIHEIWREQALYAEQGLAVETSLMLHYEVPVYFFVSRQRPELAKRIEQGLQRAQADGSFERLFRSVPSFQRSLAELEKGRRRVFELALPKQGRAVD